MEENKAQTAKVVDMLRDIKKGSWAEIEEPNGWSYHTTIGVLANSVADEIDDLELHKKHLENVTKFINNMSLFDRMKFLFNSHYIWEMVYFMTMESFSTMEEND